jgi:hypothetical protein
VPILDYHRPIRKNLLCSIRVAGSCSASSISPVTCRVTRGHDLRQCVDQCGIPINVFVGQVRVQVFDAAPECADLCQSVCVHGSPRVWVLCCCNPTGELVFVPVYGVPVFGLHCKALMCTILVSDPACRAPLTFEPRLPAFGSGQACNCTGFFVVGIDCRDVGMF